MNHLKITVIALSSLLMFSCLDTIELDVKSYEPIVVVDGEINNVDEFQAIRLSISQPYFQNQSATLIEGAEIHLMEKDMRVGTYSYTQGGEYLLQYTGKVDHSYWIEVILPNLKDFDQLSQRRISSKPEVLSAVSEITATRYEFKPESLIFEEGYYLMIDTYDPVGKGNNYRWKVQVNGEFSHDPRHIMVLEDDRIDGNLIEGLDLSYEPFEKGDELVVYQQSISNPFYAYLYDIYIQALTQDSIFDSPAYNPTSNLISDIPVVGFFNASAYHRAEIVIGE
ncbi:DUF4249 family protein [Pleomorphovibrio marinus]|uniref:DUF4249 family protein n=1 Tax=Pleomorphovibrio marinus TaxID=2164132 RepID=UPI000E0B9D6A|nr:DUF4249 family protein [Pleomorphovibrio marinus]